MKKRYDKLGFLGFRLMEFTARSLGLGLGRKLGAFLGLMFHAFVAKRRNMARRNARLAFPDWEESKLNAMVRKNFMHIFTVGMEFLYQAGAGREPLLDMVEVRGRDVLDRALAQGKGVLMLTGHIGNWEFAGGVLNALGYSCYAIARRIKNPLIDERMTEIRNTCGAKIIPHRDAVKPVMKALKRNDIVCFLLDQRALPRDGVLSEFFGHRVSTNRGLAMIALKTGTPVVFGKCTRVGGRFVIEMRDVELPQVESGREEAIAAYTREFDRQIENAVRQNPEQWFWLHKRWDVPKEMAH